MQFDYFYGSEAEQFTFYRIPKILITSQFFKKVSDSAKLLYGLMLDRMSLSIRNGWLDDDNRAYIFFTTNDVMEQMCCGTEKATKMLTELDSEKGIGLIERVKQGQGKPAIIYLKKFYELEDTARSTKLSEIESQDFQESKVKTFENRKTRLSKIESQDFWKSKNKTFENRKSGLSEIEKQDFRKSKCNNTDIKNTEFSDTDSIFPSGNGGMMDENDRYQEYFDYFSDQLSMDLLKKDYPYDSEMLDNILELIVETVCTKRPLIRIGAEERPAEIVRSRFMKLNVEHIRYVMDCFKENTTKIRNIRQYMLTTIYNAPTTIDTYYDALVRHDMSHGYLEGGFKKLKMKREEGE